MYLVAAATAFEMDAFLAAGPQSPFATLITGIGPVEASLHLTDFLTHRPSAINAVLNIGIAGAYVREESPARLLDICLARQEEFGDLGTCRQGKIEPLQVKGITIPQSFTLDEKLCDWAQTRLYSCSIPVKKGRFITVNSVSGDAERGNAILTRFPDALCENMEGAALARVCQHFAIPFLELRAISNYVANPDEQKWRLKEACRLGGQAAARLFLKKLT